LKVRESLPEYLVKADELVPIEGFQPSVTRVKKWYYGERELKERTVIIDIIQ
jgi:hypothetical protein